MKRLAELPSSSNLKKQKGINKQEYCRQYNTLIDSKYICNIDEIFCTDECIDKTKITDQMKCQPIFWGQETDIEIGPTQKIDYNHDFCEEYYERIKNVEDENPDDGIVYHGSVLILYILNKIFSEVPIIRLFDIDTGFPMTRMGTSNVLKIWNEQIYPQLVTMENWQDFWNIILSNPVIRKNVSSAVYPDNLPIIKDFLLSTSIALTNSYAGETAGFFINTLSTSPINNSLPKHIISTVFNYFKQRYNIQQVSFEKFMEYMTACKDLLNARSLNDIGKIKEIAKTTFGIKNFNWTDLNYKPHCLNNYNYDWILYQIILKPDFIQKWTYLSGRGGLPLPELQNFNISDFLQKCRYNIQSSSNLQLRIVINPDFYTQTEIIPYSPLDLDHSFDHLINLVIDSIKHKLHLI